MLGYCLTCGSGLWYYLFNIYFANNMLDAFNTYSIVNSLKCIYDANIQNKYYIYINIYYIYINI